MNGTNAAPKQTTMVVKQPSLVKAHYIYTHTIIAAGLSKNTDRQSILKQARWIHMGMCQQTIGYP